MIIVTGASGRLGSRTIQAVLDKGVPASTIGVSVRDPAMVEGLAEKGVRVRAADFDDRESLEHAFEGADAVMIISTPPPMDKRLKRHSTAVDAAHAAGAGRVVYTSVSKPVANHPFGATESHRLTEEYIKNSGIDYTILRDNLYAENTFHEVPGLMETGVLRWPNGKGRVAYVAIDDVAASAAAVLTGSGHENKIYDMTGPEALDYEEIAAALGDAIGRDVILEIISDEQYREDCRAKGMPEDRIEGSLSSYVAVEEGYFAEVTDHVRQLAGRPAKTLREVLAGYDN